MAAQGTPPPRPAANGWRTQKQPADLRRLAYQGWPFRSGTLLTDGSGNPPDIRINAAANIPAAPPPKNANNNHQPETIGSPLLSPPGLVACHDAGAPSILRLGSVQLLCLESSPPLINKRSGQSRTPLTCHRSVTRGGNSPLGSTSTAPLPYNQHSASWERCKVNFRLIRALGGPYSRTGRCELSNGRASPGGAARRLPRHWLV